MNIIHISTRITNACAAHGWETHTWGTELIARKGGHELNISDRGFARWVGPSHLGGTDDHGIVEGVKNIVAILADPDADGGAAS